MQPIDILEVRQMGDSKIEVLVVEKDGPMTEVTWENCDKTLATFPDFHL